MEIVFLCGSLEPGRDGVGDYTRRLAAGLFRNDVQSTIISLYDKQAKQINEEKQICEESAILTLRIPMHENGKNRSSAVLQWIEKTNPDWVSLQFVPFSFQKKGLPFQLTSLLVRVTKGRKMHIMFHELWVTIDIRISIKSWLLGTAQKQLIQNLMRSLKPNVVHTQTQLYHQYLVEIGANPEYLPLFTNIPIAEGLKPIEKDRRQNKISFIVFGSIYPNSMFDSFANECAEYVNIHKADITLVLVGRLGPEKEKWISIWKEKGLKLVLLGEQSSEIISRELMNASFGLTTTPYALVEKSGTAVAMLEHGLPLLCIAKPWMPPGMKKIIPVVGIKEYEPGELANFVAEAKRAPVESRIVSVAIQFLNTLKKKAALA
jgi:hypothetical protein